MQNLNATYMPAEKPKTIFFVFVQMLLIKGNNRLMHRPEGETPAEVISQDLAESDVSKMEKI